jgi:GPH family glycoside/pentoside/hexuronide:cation symporter
VPRWVEVRLGLSKDAVTWLMLPFIAVNLVGFFFFNWLAKRAGKFASLMLVFALSGVVFCLFGWSDQLGIPLSTLTCAQIVCGLAGLPVAGFGVLAFALLADVIDADAQRTGTRREAIYFGVQAILQKSMIGLSVVSFAQIQGALGPTGLRWTAIIAGLACVAGLICFSRYRLRVSG